MTPLLEEEVTVEYVKLECLVQLPEAYGTEEQWLADGFINGCTFIHGATEVETMHHTHHMTDLMCHYLEEEEVVNR